MEVPTCFSYLPKFEKKSCVNPLPFSLGASRIYSGKRYKAEEVGEGNTTQTSQDEEDTKMWEGDHQGMMLFLQTQETCIVHSAQVLPLSSLC